MTIATPGTSKGRRPNPPVLDGRTIQSHVYFGDKALHRGIFFVRFGTKDAVKEVAAFVTTVEDVLDEEEKGKSRQTAETGTLAFTLQGLEWLLGESLVPSRVSGGGGAYAAGGPSVFSRGAYRHALLIGDERKWLEQWAYGDQSKDLIHAAVIIARNTAEDVIAAGAAIKKVAGVEVVCSEQGVGGKAVQDEFGFVEGIQTIHAEIEWQSGRTVQADPNATVVDVNHLLMGDPAFNDGEPIRFRNWAVNASFLVVRRLLQDRADFERRATEVGGAHRVMGRHRNGTSLFDDNAVPVPTAKLKADATGAVCPLNAHVRKMRSEDGSPYPIFRRSFRSDGPKPALVFCSFQSSIAFAFEGLMWSSLKGHADALMSGPASPVVSGGGGYFVCLTTTGLAELLRA